MDFEPFRTLSKDSFEPANPEGLGLRKIMENYGFPMVFLRLFMVVFSRDRFRKSIRTARNYGRFSTIMANYEKLWKIMVVFRAFTSVFRDITGVPGLAPRKQLHFSKKCRKGVHSRKEVVNYAQNPRCCDLVPKADYNVHF